MTLPSKYHSPNSKFNRNRGKIFLIAVGGVIAIILYFWISAILEDPELHWRAFSASLTVGIPVGVATLLMYPFWRRFRNTKYWDSIWPKKWWTY